MKDLWLVNNTLHENGTSGWGGGIGVDNPGATGVVVRNNIASQNLSFQILVGLGVPAAAVAVDHNLIDGFRGDPEGETRGTDYVEGDPLFADAAGRCGVPASAKALSLNVTVTAPTSAGHLRLYPAGRTRALASTINFAAGETRANNAVVGLDAVGRPVCLRRPAAGHDPRRPGHDGVLRMTVPVG